MNEYDSIHNITHKTTQTAMQNSAVNPQTSYDNAYTYPAPAPAASGIRALPAPEQPAGLLEPPKAPEEAIIVTPKGVAVPPELRGLQGTSKQVGDFKGIEGSTVEDIISRVPGNWTMLPQQKGIGIRFVDEKGVERLRLHGPSTAAPAGSNSASGWTARVHAPGGKYYDNSGNLVGPRDNAGHIPISGNPIVP